MRGDRGELPRPDLRVESPRNPRIKALVRLRKPRERRERRRMLVEGYRELLRALEAGHPLEELYFAPELFLGENEGELLRRAAAAGARLVETSTAAFARLSYRDRPDGLLAVAPPVTRPLLELPLGTPPFVVVAERIEKPGNLGAILRSADAAGAAAVVAADPVTDFENPNVVRASVGTLFTVPVAAAPGEVVRAWLRERGVAIVAATPAAERLYWDVPLTGPVAIVVGAEQYGLTEAWLAAADLRVRIPMQGRADSLNVAAATTLLLYEVVRQRRFS